MVSLFAMRISKTLLNVFFFFFVLLHCSTAYLPLSNTFLKLIVNGVECNFTRCIVHSLWKYFCAVVDSLTDMLTFVTKKKRSLTALKSDTIWTLHLWEPGQSGKIIFRVYSSGMCRQPQILSTDTVMKPKLCILIQIWRVVRLQNFFGGGVS